MNLSNREIIAIAVTRPATFAHIVRGFQFDDRAECVVIEAMRAIGPGEVYETWISDVMHAAEQIEPRIDWPAWWRETVATQERLLGRIQEHKERRATNGAG